MSYDVQGSGDRILMIIGVFTLVCAAVFVVFSATLVFHFFG